MASVRKRVRSDGTTSWNVRFRYADGTATSRSFGKARHRDAFLDRLATLRAAGVPITAETLDPQPVVPEVQLTVGAWLQTWLDDVLAPRARAGNLSPRTFEGYESHVRVWLTPRLGDLALTDLTAGHVETLMYEVVAAGHKPATARRIRATLSSALSSAARRDLVARNVAHLVELPADRGRRRPSALTDDELDRVLAACTDAPLGALFHLAILTGLRASELRGLKWSDVDFEQGTYTVEAGRHRVGRRTQDRLGVGPIVEHQPKTIRSGDTTPLSTTAVAVLREHRTAQARRRLAAGTRWIDTDHVFTYPRGGGLDPKATDNGWRELLHAAGIADTAGRGVHEARRTWASRLRRAGVPVELLQALGRWESPTVPLTHYTAVDQAALRAAAESGTHPRHNT